MCGVGSRDSYLASNSKSVRSWMHGIHMYMHRSRDDSPNESSSLVSHPIHIAVCMYCLCRIQQMLPYHACSNFTFSRESVSVHIKLWRAFGQRAISLSRIKYYYTEAILCVYTSGYTVSIKQFHEMQTFEQKLSLVSVWNYTLLFKFLKEVKLIDN